MPGLVQQLIRFGSSLDYPWLVTVRSVGYEVRQTASQERVAKFGGRPQIKTTQAGGQTLKVGHQIPGYEEIQLPSGQRAR